MNEAGRLVHCAGAALVAALLARGAAAEPAPYASRPEVQAFIHEVVERHGFVEKELVFLFSRVRPVEPVLKAISAPPDKARSWPEYRSLFLNERRIALGTEFWRSQRRALARAEREFGVPAEYIVAILGVETLYGRNTGRYRVVDALSTLAFDYPPRADFFRDELVSYLLMARDEGLDVFSLRGSYAGAFGMPQFMPGSARRYAVDFDSSGAIDLSRSAADAIGSVANFLLRHGWHPGEAVLVPASVQGEAWRAYATGSVEPLYTMAELSSAGVSAAQAPAPSERVALIELGGAGTTAEYRLGLQNFYALTRYNRSAFYACAVHDLAAAIRSRVASKRPR
ncbi:MAG: lytic murein transglycosylase B [Betaproteobacteria bacterium]|nr:lytic murein transglycosylase B [Betaproteobacteria bacterium]